MLAQNEIEILSCFFPTLQDLTAKEIELKSGFSHETTFRLLKGLAQKNYLHEKKIGKTNVYVFIKNEFTYQVFVHYATKRRLQFKEKHMLLYKALLEFLKEARFVGVAIVFGSYAKGTPTKHSDIDLLCVTNNKHIEAIARTFKTKYGSHLQIVHVKQHDFKNIKKDNLVFWDDLTTFGVILDGLESFFKEVYCND